MDQANFEPLVGYSPYIMTLAIILQSTRFSIILQYVGDSRLQYIPCNLIVLQLIFVLCWHKCTDSEDLQIEGSNNKPKIRYKQGTAWQHNYLVSRQPWWYTHYKASKEACQQPNNYKKQIILAISVVPRNPYEHHN